MLLKTHIATEVVRKGNQTTVKNRAHGRIGPLRTSILRESQNWAAMLLSSSDEDCRKALRLAVLLPRHVFHPKQSPFFVLSLSKFEVRNAALL